MFNAILYCDVAWYVLCDVFKHVLRLYVNVKRKRSSLSYTHVRTPYNRIIKCYVLECFDLRLGSI